MAEYQKGRDYCGPGHGFLAWFVSDAPWGVDISYCCWVHDEQYATGGTGKDRLASDEEFYYCIKNTLRVRGIPKWLARMVARKYFAAVRILGSSRFNYHD